MAYRGIERVFCPTAALRRGCEGVERALASLDRLRLLDDDKRCAAALMACRGCADPDQCEVDADGAVCLYPLGGCDSSAVERDLALVGGEPGAAPEPYDRPAAAWGRLDDRQRALVERLASDVVSRWGLE
ncbi:MAG TPA: hypothetical protein VD978_07790 [Azospirillum sp.]|nr:hypothetical protein [Azospirillum sp.]